MSKFSGCPVPPNLSRHHREQALSSSLPSSSLSSPTFTPVPSSGELHTWRLPVPSLWPDILQKFSAAGLNAVSIYTHWGLLQPSSSPTSINFDSYRALASFYAACLDAGLWVVLRPGPYINAETTAGGIAHWATSEVDGRLRSNGTQWMKSWKDYVAEVMRESRAWQVTEGGPIVGESFFVRPMCAGEVD